MSRAAASMMRHSGDRVAKIPQQLGMPVMISRFVAGPADVDDAAAGDISRRRHFLTVSSVRMMFCYRHKQVSSPKPSQFLTRHQYRRYQRLLSAPAISRRRHLSAGRFSRDMARASAQRQQHFMPSRHFIIR